MRWLDVVICQVAGHRPVKVRRVGTEPRPGGILPSIDGYAVYEEHPSGRSIACRRCGKMLLLNPHLGLLP